jgi:diguanylate cyclase (GGDEF)-like protein/PAS domain S-box-containing protein
MRPRTVLTLYCVWMLVSTVGFYALPAWHLALWSLLALSSAGAIAAGIVMHRPSRQAPWWLLVVAVTVFAAGDTTYNVLTEVLGQENPYPSLADVFYLAMYPIMATGLQLLVRYRTGGRDRGSLLDALSLTVALGLLSWIFLIEPHVSSTELTWLERATSIAYPLGDVALLAVLARLLISSGRDRAAVLLGAGTAALLVSDVLYGLSQLQGSWQIGSWYDLGWVIFYITWGAAALHPSMTRLTVPALRLPAEMSRRRVALLMAVSLIAPGVLLVDSLTGEVRNWPMIAICSALLSLLVLARMSGVVGRHSQALERERTLRSAGTSLVSAADAADVAASVCSTVDRLVPAGTPHRAVLLVHTDAADGVCTEVATEPASSRIVPVTALRGAAADAAQGFTTALVCPLVRDDRPATGSPMGSLVVVSTETVLLTLQGAIEVLASQAALAVERVALAQEMSRRDNEAYFRTLVHNAHDVILIIDDDGRVRYASPSVHAVLGPGSIVGTPVLDLVDPDDRDAAGRALAEAARLPDADSRTRNYGVVRTDGHRIDVEVAYRDLRTDPTVRGIVLTLRDITDQRRLEQELTERAFHDGLTGLANRALFLDRVERALADRGRNGGLVGVLLVDLDDFKLVNDTLGHATGDALLVAVAGRLSGQLRPKDLAARLGGDEFAVLIEGAVRPSEVEGIAARIVEALASPIEVAGGLMTSASVGVASTGDTSGPVDLLRQADLALYAAKAAGKGRWRRYRPSLHLAAVDRLAVRTELRHALEAGQLQMRYQPIVDLTGYGTVGVEALVRWHSARRGTVLPSEFIPIAEETGLIVPLGTWVLDRALADLARWRARAATTVPISVNISAHQVRTSRFVTDVTDALARWELPPSALVLEITETALLTDDAQVSANLAMLREHGVQIAIDDFGTGFASLDYVRLHAVDSLKIDRSFVHGIEGSRRQTALVATIVHLAEALDLPVVAEGVETPRQRDALLLAGCRLGQGHLFLAPVPADDILPWFDRTCSDAAVPADGADRVDMPDHRGTSGDTDNRVLFSRPGRSRQ